MTIIEIATESVENCGSPYQEEHTKQLSEKISQYAKQECIEFYKFLKQNLYADEEQKIRLRSDVGKNAPRKDKINSEELYNLYLQQKTKQ